MYFFNDIFMPFIFVFFFFNDTATTEIYTLSLHDALPISTRPGETALFPATVGDFNDAWLAIVANEVGVGGVMVRVKMSENGVLELIVDGVVELEMRGIPFRQLHAVGVFFFLGDELRGKMTKVEENTVRRFADGEQFNHDGFFRVGEAEHTLHDAVSGGDPGLLGGGVAEISFPTAREPGEIGERSMRGRRRFFFLPLLFGGEAK